MSSTCLVCWPSQRMPIWTVVSVVTKTWNRNMACSPLPSNISARQWHGLLPFIICWLKQALWAGLTSKEVEKRESGCVWTVATVLGCVHGYFLSLKGGRCILMDVLWKYCRPYVCKRREHACSQFCGHMEWLCTPLSRILCPALRHFEPLHRFHIRAAHSGFPAS